MGSDIILRFYLKIISLPEKSFFNNEGAKRPMLRKYLVSLRNISNEV
jgi:hypothetical protein